MIVLVVDGMKCENCKKSVESGIKSISGVKKVNVDLKKGLVKVDADVSIMDDINLKVSELGFDVVSVDVI